MKFMKKLDQIQKLNKFFQALEKVSHPPGELYDLGLILKENNWGINELKKAVPYPERTEVFELNEKIHPDEFLKKIINCFENKKWLLVEVENGYLPGRIYNQLRLLSCQNRLQVFNLIGEKDEINLKMPKETRIVFIFNKESLAKVNIPNFLALFGPIIKL
jgi:hypothetical protein